MNKAEFIKELEDKGIVALDVNSPIVFIEVDGREAPVKMRSIKTYNPHEIIGFIAKSGSVAFVYEVNHVAVQNDKDYYVIRGNYA